MPLPCLEELEDEKKSYNEVITRALVEVVKQGECEHRVVSGIPQCIQLMESGADNVMLCLLSQLKPCVTARLYQVLIRAFCRDKDIGVLEVQGQHDRVAQLLSSCLAQAGALKTRAEAVQPLTLPDLDQCSGFDSSCVMIKYPKHQLSCEDELVCNYVKESLKKKTEPFVAIPNVSDTGMDMTMGFKVKTSKVKLVPADAALQSTAAQ